ncbi:MAG: hypothetical protein E4H01_15615, partial [Lysobacterales bacterium]
TSLGASAFDTPSPAQAELAAPLAATVLDTLSPADMLGVQSIASSYFVSGGSTVKAAGANFVHFGLEWDDLAPTDIEPAAYDWTAYDAEMDLAASLGYEIMITLGHNPLWAASFRRGPVDCVPLSRFTDYVSAVVTRYSASPYNVKYWALYNEPDVVGFTRTWTDCSGDTWAYGFGDDDVEYNGLNGPEHYVAHLQAAYNTIKGIDSNAVVMNGGVAYDNFASEGGYFNEDFLDQIFTAGAGNYMDAMNFHFYPQHAPRWETLTGLPGIMGKTQAIRDIMTTHGLEKPFVCTELGESSGYGGTDPRSEDTQAVAVVKQFTRAIAAGNLIGIWYNMNDYPGDLAFGEHGLLDYPSFSAKLSLDAFETLATIWPGFEFMRVMDSTELGATDLEGYLFWDTSGGEALYILWSADGSGQTITLPPGVTSVVDKFNDPVTYGATLGIDEQPVLITSSLFSLYLPLIMR